MAFDHSDGMSLKMVSVLVLSLVSYMLWGGAAAIYKGHLDQVQADLDAQEEEERPGLPGSTPESPLVPVHHNRLLALEQGIEFSIAGVLLFISNSIAQLANLGDLVSYMFAERKGYLIFSAVLLLITVLGLIGIGRVQKSLAAENPFSRRRVR